MILNKITPLLFRVVPLISKFFLLFVLGNISLDIVGEYGVCMGVLTILSTLYGLETYNVTNKFYVTDIGRFKSEYLTYCVFSFFVFFISLLFICVYLMHNNFTLMLIFIPLAAYVEYLLQEYYRLSLVAKSIKHINTFYFIKNGLWPIVFLCAVLITKSLAVGFLHFFLVQSLVLMILVYRNYDIIRSLELPKYKPISFDFVYYAVRAIVLRVNQYLDRFAVSYYLGVEMAGIVVLMTSFANLIGQVSEAITVPKYLKRTLQGLNNSNLRKYLRAMLMSGLKYSVIPILIFYLYAIYKRQELQSYVLEMIFVVGGVVVNTASLPYHHGLLSLEKPKVVLGISTINLLLSFLFINTILSIFNSMSILIYSLFVLSIIMFVIKMQIFYKIRLIE